jgi:pyrimidine-nucleoside phosphorylase
MTASTDTPGESGSSSSSSSSNGNGSSGGGAITVNVNPVEMIARLRRHAATIANTGNSKNNENVNNANKIENDGIYTDDELHTFISMYVEEEIPDYQMSAWLMAVCFCPLTPRETATLTRCYAESGRLLEWPDEGNSSNSNHSSRRPPLVDKHSSGGVGDKISLVLAPLVAACGVCVPMMAGRGLGHTGGTIDKLETSFPGYKASPESIRDFQRIVLGNNINNGVGVGVGCAIVEAGPDLCPADRRIYALRDVTSTVSCLPLQTASIMSKKIAENPDSLVLDVKYGDGAFQESVEDAQKLAESMVSVGEANGLIPTTAFLTDMNHPIGRAVGNWVEAAECIDVLKGNLSRGNNERLRLSQDLITLVVVQAGQMLHQSSGSYRKGQQERSCESKTTTVNDNDDGGAAAEGRRPYEIYETMSLDECIFHAYKVLDSGKALEKFRDMLLAQGAEPLHLKRALETPDTIPLASFVAVWTYEDNSDSDTTSITYIANIPARTIGDVAVDLGAGRTKAGETVDGQAGLVFAKQTGDPVAHGEVIATLYTNRSQDVANASLERVKASVVFEKKMREAANAHAPYPPFSTNKKIITHMVTREGGTKAFVMPGFLQGGEEGSL